MHLFNEDALRECFNELDGKKAVETDGIDLLCSFLLENAICDIAYTVV